MREETYHADRLDGKQGGEKVEGTEQKREFKVDKEASEDPVILSVFETGAGKSNCFE